MPEGKTASSTAPVAAVLAGDRRIELLPPELTLGRESDNDLVIASERASRHHARLYCDGPRWLIEDLGSLNGTYLNGERFSGQSRTLANGDRLSIGGQILTFLSGQETRLATGDERAALTQRVHLDGKRMSIGRDVANDLVLDDPNVSRRHAEIVADNGRLEVRDLGSRNGTRINGQLVDAAEVNPGAEIGIGPFRLVFDGESFVARDDRGALRLDAEAVAVRVGARELLAPTTISVEPGEFVAVVGESGSGKTTLVKALAGVTIPAQGQVTINGEPLEARLTDIGYVPQDEIVHPRLTVREALTYAARLRLPRDVTRAEIEERVNEVLEELALTAHAETRIGSLSGGQRKRAGVASELLNRPSLLLLDEPTTGLDPGLETRLMRLLRRLAGGSRAVVVVTHSTRNLELCDRLVVMGQGGQLCFSGPPRQALRFFEAGTYDDIYAALDHRSPRQWRQRFEAQERQGGRETKSHRQPSAGRPRHRRARRGRQLGVLVARYLRVLVRDGRNLAILLGQVPLLAVAVAALFKHDVLSRAGGDANTVAQLLFLMVTTALWFGSIDASRELIKEKSIFERERAIGVRVTSYLGSKLLILFALATIQTLILVGIVIAMRPLHEPLGAYGLLIAVLLATSFVAVGLGLLVSAAARTQDQATSVIPLVLIPQLLFAGALVPVAQMSKALADISSLAFAQWSFAAAGIVIDISERIAANPRVAALDRYGSSFFAGSLAENFVALAIFLALFLAGTAALLHRRSS